MRSRAMYYVLYRSETQRKNRAMVARFMYETEVSYFFDARPTAGTQELPKSWFKAAEERASTLTPYVGKVVG